MYKIINENGTISLYFLEKLDSKDYIEALKNKEFDKVHFCFENKIYNLLKDTNSFYDSYRDKNDFFVGKIVEIFVNDECVYTNENNDPNLFPYGVLMDSYNVKYNKDVDYIDQLIYNLKEYKDEFKNLFNPNFLKLDSEKVDLKVNFYRLNYIHMLEEYKKIISNENLKSREVYNKIFLIESCTKDSDDFDLTNFSLPSIKINVEKFMSNQDDFSILRRFETIMNDKINHMDFNI